MKLFVSVLILSWITIEASAITLRKTQPKLARTIQINGKRCLGKLSNPNCRMVNWGEKSYRNIAGSRKLSCHAHALAVDLRLKCDSRKYVHGQDPIMWEFADCMRRSGMYTCYANSRVGKSMGRCATSTHRDHIHIGACRGERGASRVYAYNGKSRGRQISNYVARKSNKSYKAKTTVRRAPSSFQKWRPYTRPRHTTPRKKSQRVVNMNSFFSDSQTWVRDVFQANN